MHASFPSLLGIALLLGSAPGVSAQPSFPAQSPVARSDIPGGVTTVPADILAKGLRASSLLEAGVYNAEGLRLGNVDDLVVSREGVVTVVIVELDNAVNRSGKRLAIPRQQFSQFAERLVLPDATPLILRDLPAYQGR